MREIFSGISPRKKEKLLHEVEAISYGLVKGENALTFLKNDRFIAIVDEGFIQITKEDYNGNKTIIENLKKNFIFSSLFYPLYNHEYNVIAKENSKIYVIDLDFVVSFSLKNKNSEFIIFYKNLIKIISDVLMKRNERIDILTNKSIRDKLLAFFNIEASKIGFNVIELPFSFTRLSEYLSIDRSAMNRELKNLKDERLIEVDGKRIKLLYQRY